ncbi:MAG: molecular chaperone HtpG [Christensenellales bacterium]|jgi:molecular chaperone HtpG
MHENGSISVHTQNILPIIKQWLYSEKDIFLRELVSNGCDAITKYRKLVSLGEAEGAEEDYQVRVEVDEGQRIIRVIDNGIGMTEEEVKKYINQVAFSGAEEFMQKYQQKQEGEGIIGHFGLGFYSAFMVSDKVEIDSLSYQDGSEAVYWVSEDGASYEIDASDRAERGTTITLYISEDSKDYATFFELSRVLEKYCAFLPVPVYLVRTDEPEVEGAAKEAPQPINETQPLWLKNPGECTDEDYKNFYHELFHDMSDPLFWIHLNVDYPFNLKGILYFPKLGNEFDAMEGQVKLYCNQVFVADNVKEIIPEYLLVLKGVLDCPDLPLNVSRSFLQNDGYVKRISQHITRKVADKLTGLFKADRDQYGKYWDDIHPFVKFGCLKDEKFYDRVKDALIYKNTDGAYVTLQEYRDAMGDKAQDTVYYVVDEAQQVPYIDLYRQQGMTAVIMSAGIDIPYMELIERKNAPLKFVGVDAGISDAMKQEGEGPDMEALVNSMHSAIGDEKIAVRADALKNQDVPAVMLLSEQSRRMQDMARMYRMDLSTLPMEQTLVLNSSHPLLQRIAAMEEGEEKQMLCRQVYDLAMMSHRPLKSEEMAAFIKRTQQLLTLLVDKAN